VTLREVTPLATDIPTGMAIEFTRKLQTATLLDPRYDCRVVTMTMETRWDPLTHQTVRLVDLPIKKLERLDVRRFLDADCRTCPFCPDSLDDLTPEFAREVVPEGRLRSGEACVIPNRLAFDKFCAVVVMTRQHYMPLAEFTSQHLFDAFSLARTFLRRVVKVDASIRFYSINWNYLPMAGGSVVHPHIQIIVGQFPTNVQRDMVASARRYQEYHRRNFWAELIEREKSLGERFIGTEGMTVWLASFAPRGFGDIMTIIRERSSIIELSDQDIGDVADGLVKVFRYFDEHNHYSFNMTLFSGQHGGDDSFWVNGRIVTRRFVPPMAASDVNYFEKLHGEPLAYKRPEHLCDEVRKYF